MQNPGLTITSEYAQSPTLNLIIATLNGNIDPAANITAFYQNVWLIDSAIGYGLDVLGRIVGVARVLNVSGYGQYALSDDAFRTLIYAKALSNLCDGSIPGINAILMLLFPGMGDCYVVDGANMSMTIHLGFTPNPVQAAIIAQSGVIPKPVGVLIGTPGGSVGTLAITIGAGSSASAASSSNTFGGNTATATGGSGSYSFAWNETDDSHGAWSIGGAATRTATIAVTGVAHGTPSTASLTCTVTDTVAGGTATSSGASYTMTNTTVPALSVTNGPGGGAHGAGTSNTFASNTAVATGGSGSYAYSWTQSNDGLGTWSIAGSATATATASVSLTGGNTDSRARLVCTVTDTVTGLTATSGGADYVYIQLV